MSEIRLIGKRNEEGEKEIGSEDGVEQAEVEVVMAEGWKIEKTGQSHRLGHGAKQGPIDISHYLEDFQFLGT